MKKIFAVAALVLGIFVAQVSQAEAYTPQEGDKAVVNEHTCGWCGKKLNDIQYYRNAKLIAEEKAPRYGCDNPHTNGEHYIPGGFVSYYIFTNGSWQKARNY